MRRHRVNGRQDLEVPQFYFGLPNLCDPLRGFGKTPTVAVLARGLAAASQFARCAHPTRRLRRGRIPAPRLRTFQP